MREPAASFIVKLREAKLCRAASGEWLQGDGSATAFLLTLQEIGVWFVAVYIPEANDLAAGIMALIAQAQREAISGRPKEALAVTKARIVKLGNPSGKKALGGLGKAVVAFRAAVSAGSAALAADPAPVVADIRTAGHTSLRAIATELTARGIGTRRGRAWGVGNLRRLIAA